MTLKVTLWCTQAMIFIIRYETRQYLLLVTVVAFGLCLVLATESSKRKLYTIMELQDGHCQKLI